MNARDFCFWLQGHFELQAVDPLNDGISPAQAKTIREHLNLVFVHDIDPSMGGPEHQAKLNTIHNKLPPHMDPNVPDSAFPHGRPRC